MKTTKADTTLSDMAVDGKLSEELILRQHQDQQKQERDRKLEEARLAEILDDVHRTADNNGVKAMSDQNRRPTEQNERVHRQTYEKQQGGESGQRRQNEQEDDRNRQRQAEESQETQQGGGGFSGTQP